jgi:hypothetical protein
MAPEELPKLSRPSPPHKPPQNSRDVYGWLSRPYVDTSYRRLESLPKTPVFGAFRPYPPKLCSRHDKI